MSDETGMTCLSPGTPVLIRVPGTDIEVRGEIDGPLFTLDGRPFYPVATSSQRVDVPLSRMSVDIDPERIYVVTVPDGGPPLLLRGDKFLLMSINSVGIRYGVSATATS